MNCCTSLACCSHPRPFFKSSVPFAKQNQVYVGVGGYCARDLTIVRHGKKLKRQDFFAFLCPQVPRSNPTPGVPYIVSCTTPTCRKSLHVTFVRHYEMYCLAKRVCATSTDQSSCLCFETCGRFPSEQRKFRHFFELTGPGSSADCALAIDDSDNDSMYSSDDDGMVDLTSPSRNTPQKQSVHTNEEMQPKLDAVGSGSNAEPQTSGSGGSDHQGSAITLAESALHSNDVHTCSTHNEATASGPSNASPDAVEDVDVPEVIDLC